MPSAGDDEAKERAAVRRSFAKAVNMTPRALERWLATKESRAVGWTHEGESESVGHQSGRRILEIRRKRKDALTAEDYVQMRRVSGYVHRHLAQGGPAEGVETSRWRYSLMNWGHDPLKATRRG
jgi:hypothetical protein